MLIRLILAAVASVVVVGTFLYADSQRTAAAEQEAQHQAAYSTLPEASEIQLPNLTDDSIIARGFQHFSNTCIVCHGAPGVEPSAIGKGLNPSPPDLSHAAKEMDALGLFKTVNNGIKGSGMPAFGRTYEPEDLWPVVAFVENKLPELDAESYQAYAKKHGGSQD